MVVGSPIVLNLIPGGVLPVMMINETDKGYKKEFLIYNGALPYNLPANVSATIRGTKRDGYGVTEAAEVTSGSNLVRITVTEQMTAVPGPNIFELVFEDTNNLKVATINFIMMVERSALNSNTVISDSDIAYAGQVLDQLQSVAAFKEQLDNADADIAELQDVKVQRYDTVAQMKADTALKVGMYARTGGYYAVNDGGDALYKVSSTTPETYYETLNSGLYAVLICERHHKRVEQYGINASQTGAVNSAILGRLLESYSTYEFSSEDYHFSDTIAFTSNLRNICFHGTGETIFTFDANNSVFMTDNASRYLRFVGIRFCGKESNLSRDVLTNVCFAINQFNTHEYVFEDCVFVGWNDAIQQNQLGWMGLFINCIFRNNRIHYHGIASSSYTNFIGCTLETGYDYLVYCATSGKWVFTDCLIENGMSSTGIMLYFGAEADGTKCAVFSGCYFELSIATYIDESYQNGVPYCIVAPNGFPIVIDDSCNLTTHCYLKIKNVSLCNNIRSKVIWSERVSGVADINQFLGDTKQYAILFSKDLMDASVAYCAITDTMPQIDTGKYGDSTNLYTTKADMTGGNARWKSDVYKGKALKGHHVVIEYEIADLEAFVESPNVAMTIVYWDSANNELGRITPSPAALYNSKAISDISDTALKIYEIVPMPYDNIAAFQIYAVRGDSRIKATGIYII